jgi:hypothetical protein
MATRTGFLLAAVVAGLALTGGARGDRLDGQLQKGMGELVERLKAKYKNVGVLRFRVQEGSRKETYDAPLSGRMAQRIETLLVIDNAKTEADALGVIHDAGAVAAAKRVGSRVDSLDDRKKLFTIDYPLAWGDRRVKADAFLTGKVTLSKDRRKTTVTLECFDKDDPATLAVLGTYELDTDRFVLRDLGYSFALSRGLKVKRKETGASLKDEEPLIIEEVNQTNPVGDDKGTKSAVVREGDARAEPDNIGGIAVEVLAGGKPVSIRPAGTAGDAIRWQLDSPSAGSKVAIRLKNTTDKRLAVVLRLNGVSTINEQKDDPENAAKWVIRPGKSYLLEGFYLLEAESPTEKRGLKVNKEKGGEETPPAEGDAEREAVKESDDINPLRAGSGLKLKPFKVLVGEEAKAAELGEKAGHIDIDVFEEGAAKDEEVLISPKGLPPSKEKQARSSYLGLRSALLKSSKLKTEVVKLEDRGLLTRREVIVPDKEAFASDAKVKVTSFANARLSARLTVKIVASDTLPVDE